MLKAMDVANFFVQYSNDDPQGCLTNLCLNKLLYFAQGWSLALRNKPLFEEELQAWDLGPVVPEVYHTFKPCGRDRIASVSGYYNDEIFDEDVLELLLNIEYNYGKYTASKLVEITHENNSPWSKVYKKGCNEVISKELMKDFFSKIKMMDSYSDNKITDEIITKRNGDGVLILPMEFDE